MTIQELIDKLNEVEHKDVEVRFVSNTTLDDLKIVDVVPGVYEYTVYLEFGEVEDGKTNSDS